MMETSDYALYAVGIIALLSFSYVFVLPALQQATPLATPTPQLHLAQFNDTVEVDYVLRLENGSMYDTTIASEAQAGGIWRPNVDYRPFNFTLGAHQVVPGFENAVLGMKENETRSVLIPPAEAYGEYNPQLISPFSRTYDTSRTETITLQDLLSVYPDFTNETRIVPLGGWNATVISMQGNSIVLRHDPEVGTVIQTNRWPETVANVTNDTITIRRDPSLNSMYVVETEQGPQLATVKALDASIILLDFNPPLAGHTLNFTIHLVKFLNSTG